MTKRHRGAPVQGAGVPVSKQGQTASHSQQTQQSLQRAAQAAFALGDYLRCRQAYRQLATLEPAGAARLLAQEQANKLGIDPAAVACGLGTLALYGLAWMAVL
jgi:hypothetical protein